MLLRLRSAIYAAPDLPRLKTFYGELLGKAPYFDQPFYVGFDVDGFELGLDPDASPAGAAVAFWRVAAIAPVLARAEALGARRASDPQEVGGGIKVVTLIDPSENRLGLIEEPAP
jgi:predicted enzyme related to lactoylglutathione lyase